VSATRVIAFVQGGLGALSGLFLVFGGNAVATASGVTGPRAGATVVAIGLLILVISGLLIWGGVMLGRLSPTARIGVLVYEWLALALGLLGLRNPGLGIVSLILAGVAVYYLQFDAQTKQAFVRVPTPHSTATPPPGPPSDPAP
jgi:hypothetical protein